MPTRLGWLVLFGAAALGVPGWFLGVTELVLLGCGVGATVVAAVLYVRLVRLRLEVAREVQPTRVYAGTPTRVELRVANLSARRTPALRLRDPVSGTRGAVLQLAPLQGHEAARAAYRLPTARRGIVDIGPLRIDLTDAWGLASVATRAAGRSELTVYPRIDIVAPAPQGAGRDPHAGVEQANALARSGEDFYALRPYVQGDDLRRVHWPSTARHDELMVRQDELPWQGRTTVLLDLRRGAHTAESLERAVSAAASVVMACWRRRDLVRLVATDGTDTGHAAGHAHIESVLEFLATVDVSGAGSLRATTEILGQPGNGGALVAVAGSVPDGDVDALWRLRHRYGTTTVVRFAEDAGGARAAAPAPHTYLVTVRRDQEFAAAWDAVHRRRGSRPRRAVAQGTAVGATPGGGS